MLIIIFGKVGTGKTLYTVLKSYYSLREVVANIELKIGKKVGKFEFKIFKKGGYEKKLVLIDEAYVYFNSRSSTSSNNKESSTTLFQMRKTSMDIILTMPLRRSVDINFREMADIVIFAKGLRNGAYYYQVNDFLEDRVYYEKISLDIAKELYKMFNTYQIIHLDEEEEVNELSIEERRKYLDKMREDLFKRFKNQSITKDKVDLFIFENKIDKQMKDILYCYAKEKESERNEKTKRKSKTV